MKNLIVQIFMNKKGWEEEHRLDGQSSEVLILSNILVKNYAKKIHADYKLLTKPIINFKHLGKDFNFSMISGLMHIKIFYIWIRMFLVGLTHQIFLILSII